MTASDTLAPWAEIVPNAGPMTADDLLARPDDGWQYELVEGRLVRMPPSGYRASRIAGRLYAAVLTFVDAHALGAVTPADGGYDLGPAGQKNTTLAPDVAFVRADRLPPHVVFDEEKAVPFAPDLAAEVASPHQYRPGMAQKAQRYLAAGTRLVWIIWPKQHQVDVWRQGDTQPAQTLGITDTLSGEMVLPGFSYPVKDLFV